MPPSIDPERHMFRHHVIRSLIIDHQCNFSHVFIQAQAGQGKSVLAAQFIDYLQADFAWIQLDEEDRSTTVLAAALLAALYKDFPNLEDSELYKAIIDEEIDDETPAHIISNLLTNALTPWQGDYYLVIDDLHLLKFSKNAISFLQTFSDRVPPNFHLILLSRSPICGFSKNYIYLENHDLALRLDEVTNLLTNFYELPLTYEMAMELHQATEGWIMGLLMAKHALSDIPLDSISKSFPMLKDCKPNQYQSYFQNELLSSLGVFQRQTLYSLSLLENIPLALAQSLSWPQDISDFLKQMLQNNYFLRCVQDPDPVYYFHQLFKDVLEEQARKKLSKRQIRKVLAKAGHWFLKRGQKEPALRYYLKAGAYGMADKLLRNETLNILSTHRISVLNEVIDSIFHRDLHSYPWVSFFIANIHFRNQPFKSLAYLKQAHGQFIIKRDELGELISVAVLIAFHAAIDCRFNQGKMLLPRAEELFELHYQNLSISARVQCAYAIAIALCYFTGETQKADNYIRPIFKLSQETGMEDTMAGAAIAKGLIYCLSGNWSAYRRHVENTHFLLLSPRVSRLFKLLLFSQKVALLGLEGSFVVYDYYRNQMKDIRDPKLLSQNISDPLLVIADINNALAQGRMEEAGNCLQVGFVSGNSAQSAHLQSLYLGYQAYLLAAGGYRKEVLRIAKKALRLRREAGGEYHDVAMKMILGGVYTLLNLPRIAEPLLTKAIERSKRMGETFIRASAYAHRAVLRKNNRQDTAGLEDIRSFLTIMRENSYLFCHLWNPKIMTQLLTTAIENDIEKEYAAKLAEERMNLSIPCRGPSIPIMELLTLGSLAIKLNGKVKAGFEDFTPTQRELLALLASSPQAGVSLEIIQLSFWPDTPPDKIRSKLDNLLGRLRKTLNKLLHPNPASFYLSTEKGFIRLTNCRIDVTVFMDSVRLGFKHLKGKAYWQADNAFLKACICYQGEFMPKIDLGDKIAYYRQALQKSFLEISQRRISFLSENVRVDEATAVCRRALEVDPTCRPLIRKLYHLLIQSNQSEKAAACIEDYKKALIKEGFSSSLISTIMNDFWMEK